MDTNQFTVPEELRWSYLNHRSKDVQDCFSKLDVCDWGYFERLGHQLKGNAPNFGYEDLSEIAFQIEASALDKDLSKLEGSVRAFQNWIGLHRKFQRGPCVIGRSI